MAEYNIKFKKLKCKKRQEIGGQMSHILFF